MNEKMYQANIKLVDENNLLKEDKKILQKRIDKAIEYMESNSKINVDDYVAIIDFYKELKCILKGDKIDE